MYCSDKYDGWSNSHWSEFCQQPIQERFILGDLDFLLVGSTEEPYKFPWIWDYRELLSDSGNADGMNFLIIYLFCKWLDLK